MNFTFDWNEGFMLISTIIVFSLFLIIRKYFQPVLTIVIWVFTIAYLETIDYFLAATIFDLYYFGDNSTYEVSTGLIHGFLYPSFSMIFLYIYDKWNIRGKKLFTYLFVWTVKSIFYEWLCVRNSVLVYNGWKLYYSIPFYPVSAVILLIVFHKSKKQLDKVYNQGLILS